MEHNYQAKSPSRVNLSEHIEVSQAGDVCPKGSPISVKHIAYLYVYCNTHPRDIRSRYSRVLTDAHVHFALAHYYSNRKLFDAQIAEDRMLHAHDALSRYGRLPAVGVGAILEAAEIEARPPAEKKSTLAEG